MGICTYFRPHNAGLQPADVLSSYLGRCPSPSLGKTTKHQQAEGMRYAGLKGEQNINSNPNSPPEILTPPNLRSCGKILRYHPEYENISRIDF